MKVVLLFVFTAFLVVTLNAQDYPNLLSNTKVTTIGYWKVGQKARYTVTSKDIAYKSNSDKIKKETESKYTIEIKVVDSTATSYDFELRYLDFEVKEDEDKFLSKLTNLQLESVIKYRTDELGIFDTILNLSELNEELIDKLNQSKTLVAEDAELKERSEFYNMIIDAFIQNFKALENVEAFYLIDILPIHGYYGIEMDLNKAMDLQLEFPTMADVVMTGQAKLTLNAINKPKDECSFFVSGKPNKEELKEYIAAFVMLFALDSGKKIEMQEANVNMNMKIKMKMELSTGWMTKVSESTTTTIKDEKRELKKVSTREFLRV